GSTRRAAAVPQVPCCLWSGRRHRGHPSCPTRRSSDLRELADQVHGIFGGELVQQVVGGRGDVRLHGPDHAGGERTIDQPPQTSIDRKSTRLNSSHVKISYAVVCLNTKIKLRCDA